MARRNLRWEVIIKRYTVYKGWYIVFISFTSNGNNKAYVTKLNTWNTYTLHILIPNLNENHESFKKQYNADKIP